MRLRPARPVTSGLLSSRSISSSFKKGRSRLFNFSATSGLSRMIRPQLRESVDNACRPPPMLMRARSQVISGELSSAKRKSSLHSASVSALSMTAASHLLYSGSGGSVAAKSITRQVAFAGGCGGRKSALCWCLMLAFRVYCET